MDFKKFYLSPEGRVNRKQFWLWLVLPLTVMGVLLASIDIGSGNYNPETGIGLFTGIFALLTLIPTIIVYVKRFHDRDKFRLVGADRPHPDHRSDLASDRARLSQGHARAEPVRSTRDGLSGTPVEIARIRTRVRQARISTPVLA